MNLTKPEDMYNRNRPRVKQGENRAKKGQYHPTGVRAKHHVQFDPKTDKRD